MKFISVSEYVPRRRVKSKVTLGIHKSTTLKDGTQTYAFNISIDKELGEVCGFRHGSSVDVLFAKSSNIIKVVLNKNSEKLHLSQSKHNNKLSVSFKYHEWMPRVYNAICISIEPSFGVLQIHWSDPIKDSNRQKSRTKSSQECIDSINEYRFRGSYGETLPL